MQRKHMVWSMVHMYLMHGGNVCSHPLESIHGQVKLLFMIKSLFFYFFICLLFMHGGEVCSHPLWDFMHGARPDRATSELG